MRAKASLCNGIDYDKFTSPYTGIAAMIFVQTDQDLRHLQGLEKTYRNGSLLDRWEIVNFLKSPWASFLAECVGIGQDELDRYAKAAML